MRELLETVKTAQTVINHYVNVSKLRVHRLAVTARGLSQRQRT